MDDTEPTRQEIDMSLDVLECHADAWAARINLSATIENVISGIMAQTQNRHRCRCGPSAAPSRPALARVPVPIRVGAVIRA
jgi:hypothetical protein